MPARIPSDKLLKDLQRVAEILGRAPRKIEYENLGSFNSITLGKRFGSWDDCIRAAGLDPLPHSKQKWTDEGLRLELDRLELLLGRMPTFTDVKKHGRISPETFQRRIDPRIFSPQLEQPLIIDWAIDKIPPELGAWVSGLVDGEGSFLVKLSGETCFRVGLRADDRHALEIVRQVLGISNSVRVYSNQKRRDKGQNVGDEARLFISNRQIQKARIVPFFERFPLRTKKALEFALYKEMVLLSCVKDDETPRRARYTQGELATFKDITKRVKALRYDLTKAIITSQETGT